MNDKQVVEVAEFIYEELYGWKQEAPFFSELVVEHRNEYYKCAEKVIELVATGEVKNG